MVQVTERLHLPKLGLSVTRSEALAWTRHGLRPRWHVLLAFGQSVVEGGGPLPAQQETLPGEPDAPVDGVYMLTKAGSVVPAKSPTSELIPGLAGDPILHAAKWLLARMGPLDRILIVNRAVGGTGFDAGNWNPGDGVYEDAVAAANTALGLEGATALALLWIQGVSDATSYATAEAHAPAARAMFEALRGGDLIDDLNGGHESLPIVIGTTAEAKSPPALLVNQGYFGLAYELPYVAVADLRDLSYSDGFHPDHDARRVIGRRMGAAYYEALANRGGADITRHLPTPVARVRAVASTLSFGDVVLETPLVDETPGEKPTLVNVSDGTPFEGVGGLDGIPRGSVVVFNEGGFRLANHPIRARGFSFCAWVNPGATGADLPVLAPATLQAGGSLENPGFLIQLEFAEQFLLDGVQRSTFRVRAQGPISGKVRSEARVISGLWQHLCVVNAPRFDEVNGDFYVFLNAVLVASWTQENLPALEMQVGCLTTEYAASFGGFMDDIRYYNCPLSPAQVEAVYRSSMSPEGGGGVFPMP